MDRPGLEPGASALPRRRSTIELPAPIEKLNKILILFFSGPFLPFALRTTSLEMNLALPRAKVKNFATILYKHLASTWL